MPRIADYIVIKDPKVLLQQNADIDKVFDFNLENSTVLTEGAILSFVVTTTPGALLSSLEVKINPLDPSPESQSYAASSGGPTSYAIHKCIDPGKLKIGLNKVMFRILPGSASVQIGDVALHYQRDI